MSVEQIGIKGTGNTKTEEQLITGQNGTPEILDIRKLKKNSREKRKTKNKKGEGEGGAKPVTERMKKLDHIAQLGDSLKMGQQ